MINPLTWKELKGQIRLDDLDKERFNINCLILTKYNPQGFSGVYDVEHLNFEQRAKLVRDYSSFNAQLFNGQYNDEPWTFQILWFPDRK